MSPPRGKRAGPFAARETRIPLKRGACRRERLRDDRRSTEGRAGNNGLLGGAPLRLKRRDKPINSYTEDRPRS